MAALWISKIGGFRDANRLDDKLHIPYDRSLVQSGKGNIYIGFQKMIPAKAPLGPKKEIRERWVF